MSKGASRLGFKKYMSPEFYKLTPINWTRSVKFGTPYFKKRLLLLQDNFFGIHQVVRSIINFDEVNPLTAPVVERNHVLLGIHGATKYFLTQGIENFDGPTRHIR